MESTNLMVINGNELPFEPGETILDVARRGHIDIPTLCHLKGTTPTGACRICVVEVKGARTLLPACSTPAAPNMVVRTESPEVVTSRKEILRLMLSSGNHNCAVRGRDDSDWTQFQLGVEKDDGSDALCPVWGDCRLQDLAYRYQVTGEGFQGTPARYPMETVNPFIVRDFSRCILCGRCVQACNEVQVNNAISFGYRGAETKIIAAGDRPLKDSDCVFAASACRPARWGRWWKRMCATTCGPGRPKKCAPPAVTAAWVASFTCTSGQSGGQGDRRRG
jgi:NADH dehydrogenase/NADH:ubiquinone oxidoreductase subunit G